MSRVLQASEALLEQFRGKRKYLLEGDLLPESIAEAYAVQAAFQGALAGEYGAVAGYKIAYTTAALQQASGISEPVAGRILSNNVRHSPSALASGDFLQPGIECEVGIRLGADLPASGAPYDRQSVSKAVEAVMTAFEVIDNRRTQGQDTQTQLLTTIASNILNAGVVLGAAVTDWRSIDLAASAGLDDHQRRNGGRGPRFRRYGASAGAAGLAGQRPGGSRRGTVCRNGGDHRQHRAAQVAEAGRLGGNRHRGSGAGRAKRCLAYRRYSHGVGTGHGFGVRAGSVAY